MEGRRLSAHRRQHLHHRTAQSQLDRPADEVVPDVQFMQMRDGQQWREIFRGDAMPRIDLQTKGTCLRSGRYQALEFSFTLGPRRIRIRPGVQLNHLRLDPRGGFHLRGIGIDEQADPDAMRMQQVDTGGDGGFVRHHVQPALGTDFLTVFRHHADTVRPGLAGDPDDLRRVADFQVQAHTRDRPDGKKIRILNMPPVFPQVNCNPICPGRETVRHGYQQARFHVVGLRCLRITRLPQRRHVIDIYSQFQHDDKFFGSALKRLISTPVRKFCSISNLPDTLPAHPASNSPGMIRPILRTWVLLTAPEASGNAAVLRGSMQEVAESGEDHAHAAFIGGPYHLRVLDGTPGLDGGGGSSIGGGDESVREGKHGVAGDHTAFE